MGKIGSNCRTRVNKGYPVHHPFVSLYKESFMSDTSPFGFGRFVPGFDFLQNLSKEASAGLASVPPMASWVAPTLSVEDIDKRIRELKTVQFWLEQNGRALGATVQALEVQRMTLATLQGMNVAMKDLAGALGGTGAMGSQEAAAPAAPPKAASATPKAQPAAPQEEADGTGAGLIDPMQWWGALTQQFQDIASKTLSDASVQQAALAATREMTSGAFKAASDMASQLSGSALSAATGNKGGKTSASASATKAAPAAAVPTKKAAAKKKSAPATTPRKR